MNETYNYKDGFGGELTVIVNHANIQLTTADTVEGDSVTMQLNLSETKQLIKALKSATRHVKND